MVSRKATLGLLVAVALTGLLAFVVFKMIPGDSSRIRQNRLIALDVGSLDSIDITRGMVNLSCKRQRGRWWLTHPVEVRADDERVLRLLDALALVPVRDTLPFPSAEEFDAALKDYGLDAPAAIVRLSGAAGNAELRFGLSPLSRKTVYATVSGIRAIRMLPMSVFEALPAGFSDLRDRSMLPYSVALLQRFELDVPGGETLVVEKDAEDIWWIRQPLLRRCDPVVISGILNTLSQVKIETFVMTGPAMPANSTLAERTALGTPYGCTPEESGLIVRFWFANSMATLGACEFVFGKDVPDAAESLYVLSTEEQLMMVAKRSLRSVFEVSPETLRNRHIWNIAPATVQRISFRGAHGNVSLERGAHAEWNIIEPIAAATPPGVCDALLGAFATLTDVAITDVERPERDGLWVEITSRASDTPATMMVAHIEGPFRDTLVSNAVPLRWFNPLTSQIQRTETNSLPLLFGTTEFFASLRDTRIIFLDPAHITEMRQTLAERPEASLTGDHATFPALAAAFAELRAERVEALVAESLDNYGLKAPVATVSVSRRNGDAVASFTRVLLIGAEAAPGKRYAMVKGQDSVFVLSANDTKLLTTPFP